MQTQESMLALRRALARRETTLGTEATPSPSEGTVNLSIILFALIFMAMLMASVLLMLRRIKRQQQMRAAVLPQYHDVAGDHRRNPNHRRLTITTTGTPVGDGRHSVLVFRDGKPMLANPESPPHSPDNVPQIHITFPDEHDDHGRPKSGRVVVVRVGETSIGMEPLHHDEQLPAYEKESTSQFYSIDIEKIGGLKEKDSREFR